MIDRRWKALGWIAAGALALTAGTALAGQITLYEHPAFRGHSMTTDDALPNLERSAFDDVASSVIVRDGTWEACTEPRYSGRCAELVPGNYSRLNSELKGSIASIRQIGFEPAPARFVVTPDRTPVIVSAAPSTAAATTAPLVVASPTPYVAPTVVAAVPIPAGPRLTLYEHSGGSIRAVEVTANVDDLGVRQFGDSADAALVSGGLWRLCDGLYGRGSCTDFPPGQYASLGPLDGKVRSAYLVAPIAERGTTVAVVPPGRAVLFEYPNFGGASAVVAHGRAPDLDWARFKNPAESIRIETGNWLVCADIGYQGHCRVLGPGEYPHVTGLQEGIASARQVWRPDYAALENGRDH
jgi:hypothetical protein